MSFLFTTLCEKFDFEILVKTILKDYEDKFHIIRNIWKIFEKDLQIFKQDIDHAQKFNAEFRNSFLGKYPPKITLFESPPNSVIVGAEDQQEQLVDNLPINNDLPAIHQDMTLEEFLNC